MSVQQTTSATLGFYDTIFNTKQQHENSCWACCVRAICCYLNGKGKKIKTFNDDSDVARKYKGEKGDPNKQESAADVMDGLGIKTGIDKKAVPMPHEICHQIKNCCPMLALVSSSPGKNKNATGGHWIVIVGIEMNFNGKNVTLHIFDPGEGGVVFVDYDKKKYKKDIYWNNCSYLNCWNDWSDSSE